MQQPLLDDPTYEAAVALAFRTERALDARGWYLWRCDVMDGDTIAIVSDDTVELPAHIKSRVHAVYTDDEMRWIAEQNTGHVLTCARRLRKWQGYKRAAYACGQRLVIAKITEAV